MLTVSVSRTTQPGGATAPELALASADFQYPSDKKPRDRGALPRHPGVRSRREAPLRTPFLSTYQIAIAFDQRFRREASLIAKPVGGKDTGRHDSLAKHFANQLSRRIRQRTLPGIEGRFLNGRFLGSLEYDNRGETVASSLGEANLSIFRLSSR